MTGRGTVPNGSMCAIGLSVTRPRRRAKSSPSHHAVVACAASWTVSDNNTTTSAAVTRPQLISSNLAVSIKPNIPACSTEEAGSATCDTGAIESEEPVSTGEKRRQPAVSFLAPGAQVANYSSFDFSSPVAASGFPLASVFGALCTILKLSFMVNVFLAFFNLIPIPPLDGSWVLEHLFPRTLGPFYSRIRPYGFILFLLLIYSNRNILVYLLLPAFFTMGPGFALLSWCTSLG